MLNPDLDSAMSEAIQFDLSDYMYLPVTYFSCGFSKRPYYNFNYAKALCLIGEIYGAVFAGQSSYKRGVRYLAQQCGVTRNQIKSLRKKLRYRDGYRDKIPYKIYEIAKKIIALLEEKRDEQCVSEFIANQNEQMWRSILIGRQYEDIKMYAQSETNSKAKAVYIHLREMTQSV